MADFNVDTTAPNFDLELALLGVTGSAHYAAVGATLPTGLEAYTEPFVNLGWISDEGLTESISEEKTAWTPWQSVGPIRSQVTSQQFTFQLTLWSIGGLANALRYGVPESDMTYDAVGEFVEFTQGGEIPKDFRFVLPLDLLDGDKHRRFILPSASVEERGDVIYTKSELVGYPFTFAANLDPSIGFSIMRRFKEGWKPGTSGSLLTSGGAASLGDWHERVTAGEPPTGG